MSGSTRTIHVSLGIRQLGAALAAVAVATVLAGVLAVGQLTPAEPQTAPAAGAAPVVIDHTTHTGGSNGTRFPQ